MCSSITSFLQITGTNNQQACSRSDLRTTVRPKYVIEFKSASRSFPKFRTLHNFVLAYENNYLIIKPLKHWKIIYILFAILMHILRSIEAFLQSLGKPLSSTNLKFLDGGRERWSFDLFYTMSTFIIILSTYGPPSTPIPSFCMLADE